MKRARHAVGSACTLVVLLAGCGKADVEVDFTPDANAPPRDAAGNPFFNVPDAGGGDASVDAGGPRVVPDGGLDIDCGATPFAASLVPANLLLVIDKSGSMAETPPGFGTDKWSAMRQALEDSLGVVAEGLSLGVDFYPFPDGCEVPAGNDVAVPVEAGATALQKILDALDATGPSGGTPTARALARARRYFADGDGANLEGDSYVLLATDGGPNCNQALTCGAGACTVNLDGECPMGVANCCDPALAGPGAQVGCLDDDATVQQVHRLANAGISTFVVGIPGTEAYADTLDAFAEAGGRPSPSPPPSYFAVDAAGTGTGGLTSVLQSITQGLITRCKFQLDSDPPDVTRLNVEIDGEVVPMQGADGWTIDTTTSPPTVVIQGATCERVEAEGAQSVVITFGCPTKLE